MKLITPNRRRFLKGAAALALAAPSIIRPSAGQIVQFSGGRPPFPNSALFPRLAAGVANVKGGVSNASIFFVGDSTTAGYGATSNPDGWTGSWLNCFPTQFSSLLNAKVTASPNSFFCDNNTQENSVAVSAYNAKLNQGTWQLNAFNNTASASFADQQFFNNGSGTFSFAPGVTTDTVDFWHPTDPSYASMTFNIGGGTLATINESAADSFIKTTISYTRGVATLNFVSPASGTVWINGAVAYDSLNKAVNVLNGGWFAAFISDMIGAASPWSPLNAIPALASNLYVVCLTINDWSNNTGTSAFSTNTQTLITRLAATGADILLMSGFPSSTSVASVLQQQSYIDVYTALAASNNLPMLNLTTVFGSWAAANAAGYAFDAQHPSPTGCGVIAQAIMNKLSP